MPICTACDERTEFHCVYCNEVVCSTCAFVCQLCDNGIVCKNCEKAICEKCNEESCIECTEQCQSCGLSRVCVECKNLCQNCENPIYICEECEENLEDDNKWKAEYCAECARSGYICSECEKYARYVIHFPNANVIICKQCCEDCA